MEEQILTPIIGSEDGQAVLSTWSIKVGDQITVGQIIATIETNKAVLDLESTKKGEVKELLVSAGSEIEDLQPLVTVAVE
jgi:pyruvate/2-oxoglutarate dehydrogenase complex dihydrolipoamide acyltransferase (E2) component